MKNVTWEQFNFQRIHCEKESEEVYMLIWTTFNSFAIISNVSSLPHKYGFEIEFVLEKGLEHVFRSQVL